MAFQSAKNRVLINSGYPLGGMFSPDIGGQIAAFLESEGKHDGICVSWGQSHSTDEFTVDVYCSSCDRAWRQSVSNMAMKMHPSDPQMFIETVWVPFFKQIADTLCYKLSMVAELAEWLTSRVAAAEPHGLRYSALASDAVKMHLCARQDVDAMLMKLGFNVDWDSTPVWNARTDSPEARMDVAYIGGVLVNDPRVRLPAGHPLRKEI